MKKVILDTNLLFSALLSGNVAFREIMHDPAYQIFSAKYRPFDCRQMSRTYPIAFRQTRSYFSRQNQVK